jgi:predicted AAA+ superfamily ATPase
MSCILTMPSPKRFDATVDVENARQDPDLFLANHPGPIVFDEIQYAPELVGAIKRRIDRDRRPGHFVMMGSQQWGALKNRAESLGGGRAVFIELYGFTLAEIAREPCSWLASWLTAPEAFVKQPHERLTPLPPLYEHLWRGFLYHWRSNGGAEVDLLLERDGHFLARCGSPLEAHPALDSHRWRC